VQYSIDGEITGTTLTTDNNVSGGENITVNAPTGQTLLSERFVLTQMETGATLKLPTQEASMFMFFKNGDQAP
jgi:hypothetical protein